MAQTVTLWGATYSNVPALTVPSGSSTARFDDTSDADATASDIASGKTAYVNGSKITGTASGGGGVGTLLATLSLGTVNQTSTNATNLNKSVSVSGINSYDALIIETSVNTKTNGRHAATVRWLLLTASSAVTTKDGSAFATATWNCRLSSTGTVTTRSSTTVYGVYPNSCSISSGTATIAMYARLNNTQTGTINGAYTTRVYGVKLYDLIGG